MGKLHMRTPCRAVLLLVCCLLAGPASAQTTFNLDVFNLDFGNATTGTHMDPTIHVGDTVDWHWVAGTHSVTSVAGQTDPFNSGDQSPTFSFTHTFNTAGTYWYYCDIHGFDVGNGTATGMSGRVFVTPVPEPTAILVVAGVVGVGVVGIRRRSWIGRRVASPFAHSGRRAWLVESQTASPEFPFDEPEPVAVSPCRSRW
jgi:plastocyanin